MYPVWAIYFFPYNAFTVASTSMTNGSRFNHSNTMDMKRSRLRGLFGGIDEEAANIVCTVASFDTEQSCGTFRTGPSW